MPDQPYKNWPFIFASKGVVARPVTDTVPVEEFLNLDNCEELAEGSFGNRLGSVVINSSGTLGGAVFPLSAKVVTCSKLNGLFGATWRYAVTADGKLWRRSGLTAGAYTQISSGFSGNPIYAASFVPAVASNPWMYFADASGMYKDNGTLAAPQQLGCFQPQFPIAAQSQSPTEIILDPMRSSSYTTSGIGSFSPNSVENSTNTSAAITATGIQAVPVNGGAGVSWLGLFQSLVVDTGGNEETVLVIGLTATGFIANFTKVHANGVTVDEYGWSGTVAASATGTVSRAFSGTPISAWPLILSQSDYIGVWIYVSDPTQVQSIQLAFTLADGSSFYKVVAQGPLQNLLTTASTNSTAAATAATDAILSESLGLYGNSASSIGELNAGGGWTPLLFQLSDFASTGNADFDALFDNWANVTGYTVTIIANDNAAPVLIEMSSLVLFGGAGPDTFAGVAYDYLFTFYNDNDGTESNPCMVMSNVNPPNSTNWVYPRRQPVLLTMNLKTYAQAGQLQDGQITAIRIYRRGGTLGDNYRRVDEIPVNIAAGGTVQYTDTTSDEDLAASDFISFTNDVPVTSSLPNPVNNTLGVAINTTNQVATITLATGYPAFSSPISVRQQVTLGSPTNIANNFETVIVLTLILTGPPLNKSVTGFTAFVQNTHAIGEQVQATEKIGQPVSGICIAFGQAWFWGDPLNPSTLYWSAKGNPQAVSSAANIDTGSPDDPLTAVVGFAGNLYISAPKAGWQSVAPGSNANASPTIYPTKCKHGCVANFGFVATEEGIPYCLPEEESEILTRTGWKTRKDLRIGEEVLAYDMESRLCKWTPVRKINVFDYEGDLVKMKGGRTGIRFDFSCTPDHKWIWKPEKRTTPYKKAQADAKRYPWAFDLCACGEFKAKPSRRCRACASGRNLQLKEATRLSQAGNVVQAAPITTGKSLLTPREAAILGWIVTDGTVRGGDGKKRRSARIFQIEESRYVPRIKKLLGDDVTSIGRCVIDSGYGKKYGKKVTELSFLISTEFTEILLQKAGFGSKDDLEKIVLQLDLEAAGSMLAAMLDGDGSRGKATTFGQNKGPVMDAFRLLAFMCGYPTSDPNYKKLEGYRKEHGRVTLCRNADIDCQSIKKTLRPFSGKVWCPTTDYGTWVARSNGTISITGNCAVDGIRFFAGGASVYLTQSVEFIWQGIGSTPIVISDPTKFSQTIIQYWNSMIFISYIGLDGNRHRLIGHQIYKRWRNDDVDAQAMFLEVDTNDLVYGDSNGLVHIDRQNLGYDQGLVGGVLAQVPIAINLQTSYQNQGLPANQKQYQNLQLDAATAGQPLTITLLFNDGQQSIVLGTVTTAQRAKVNLPINSGDGQQAYKASLQITGNLTQQIAIYQASLEALPLPITRRAFDSFKMNLSAPDSKIARDIFWIYSAAAPIVVSVYYDDSPTAGFTFTMPTAGGIRNPLRQRLPAVSFRTIRFVGLSTGDFMLWPDSCLWYKMQCQGRGYEKALFVEN